MKKCFFGAIKHLFFQISEFSQATFHEKTLLKAKPCKAPGRYPPSLRPVPSPTRPGRSTPEDLPVKWIPELSEDPVQVPFVYGTQIEVPT